MRFVTREPMHARGRSFGFTPSPLAPCCSRDNDDVAQKPVKKKALLVFPTYGPEDDEDIAMHNYLIKMRLLPAGILNHSAQHHIELLKPRLIERGFEVELWKPVKPETPWVTYITAPELKEKIKGILKAAPPVLLIVYCGHGQSSTASGTPGPNTFFLSGGTRITVHELGDLLAQYQGTLIQFFNTCSAGPHDPWAYNAAPAATPSPKPHHGKYFNVYSSHANQTQKAEYALAATEAFVSLFGQEYAQLRLLPPVPVKTVDTSEDGMSSEATHLTIDAGAKTVDTSKDGISKEATHLTIDAGANYDGVFPDVASTMVSG